MEKIISALVTASASAVSMASAVNFIECPKCDKRMRISADGMSATVNLCRLSDDSPDEATLERRKADMARRVEEYLQLGQRRADGDRKCPLMGWSSWNTFGVDISEEIILETARAMASNGLKDAGYMYVNIDDGFFDGHDENGNLRFHPTRFPRGMKGTVDGIHALGLKAGTYSDAGSDTCGSMWSGDPRGRASGLYGHDAADCKLHFNDLGFDFIKVDFCGGRTLKLDEHDRYTEISKAILATGRTDVRFNICRWAFPGIWAADIADSWRTTEDIRANWKSVRGIIDENLFLSAYASPGHYNDMDMLEVGHRLGMVKSAFSNHGDTGLTETEETTHFGMWCMFSSPLLIGCDVRSLPEFTHSLITNPYLIEMNQNRGLGVQGYVVQHFGEGYVLVKDAEERFGKSRYVALYNASDAEVEMRVESAALDLGGEIAAFDLVEKADVGVFTDHVFVKVPAHGAKFYRMDAEVRLERSVYGGETAMLSDYQALRDPVKAGTAHPSRCDSASCGVVVRFLGNRASNDLVWKEVKIDHGGHRTLEFICATQEKRTFTVDIDGHKVADVTVESTGGFNIFRPIAIEVDLSAGLHTVRLHNDSQWAPDIDMMRVK